ncbi:hypothetical protein BABINDRAFT_162604 [Babjeviella inositovora NRRL Y-12698]|uniref:Carboxymuconolactone decarboxylase-like domain-containing protein n=1 Tax=Babjeviella inositovora NRRL Y-12698 TaxID=984486 RepID=A0A1E3QL07_9ASCO|nr:uncharacterized protein BABINDRAFT_162604 [Babjeviella inositovora NRRL Y-12698]ODQ78365.1 hypothetical protein BABINDRAFT_162604 [Babjeviella inositovora NRRL Y-12698]
MTILTAARLLRVSSTSALLSSHWYYIAAATLTACNQPQELPKLYHYLMLTNASHTVTPTLEDANEAIVSAKAYQELSAEGSAMPLFPNSAAQLTVQQEQTNKIKDALLKAIALCGVPRVINALMTLKTATPSALRADELSVRATETDSATIITERERGYKFWDQVYGKINNRVAHQMSSAYPDLWTYTINHIYGPLLSCTDVLSARESSLVIIACLVPQDVNPQLKGHLKGALNNGCTLEEIRAARELVIEISGWCGVSWRNDVAKL